jgi:hypothetical protein
VSASNPATEGDRSIVPVGVDLCHQRYAQQDLDKQRFEFLQKAPPDVGDGPMVRWPGWLLAQMKPNAIESYVARANLRLAAGGVPA